jgi:hypothetical protein
MEDNEYGPWIIWGRHERPAGLRDDQTIEAVFINIHGELKSNSLSRSVGAHSWAGHGVKAVTLAYRVKREEVARAIYGRPDGIWGDMGIADTHKITYVLDGDGEVISCQMRKL